MEKAEFEEKKWALLMRYVKFSLDLIMKEHRILCECWDGYQT